MLITTATPNFLPAPAPAGDSGALCTECGDEAPNGADDARDHHGWWMDDHGDLHCEDCTTTDQPTSPYDTAYWG